MAEASPTVWVFSSFVKTAERNGFSSNSHIVRWVHYSGPINISVRAFLFFFPERAQIATSVFKAVGAMRTRRGRRSEAFWPSLVMKKWLNIKPKVYDFSEDEIDTETESEDDVSSLKDGRIDVEDHISRVQGNGFTCSSHIPDTPKSYKFRHRRGKSETLRVQYINTKDLRVTIGTWNVAGQSPCEELALDDWLHTEEPADIYIIGFQEIVPLNAGNVLGAEDSRPIPMWEAIIRRTLNKSFEPESKHKSYSAPPSPVMRTSSVDDVLADEAIDNQLEMMNEEFDMEEHGLNMRNLQLKRIFGFDSDSRLDWPEQSLDSVPQVLSSNPKLRRVFSSNARMCFNLSENPHKFALNVGGLRRSYHSSGNLISILKEQEEKEEILDSRTHVSDCVFEEEEDAFSEEQMEEENGAKSHSRYVRIVGKQMVGIYVSVWVRKRMRRHVNNLKVSPVGIGLMGYLGNKGSVSISMSLFQSRLCFVCSHLTSGQKDGAEQKRNADVNEIIRRTCFSSSVFDVESDQPQTIPCHDKIFWFGDLNYRLNMLDSDVRQLVNLKQWNELKNYDQLSRELHSGRVFEGWKEGVIDFPPTYKYEVNSDRYVGENPKEGEKKRSPAWCDRILWLGKGIKQLCYKRSEVQLSDHRPVSSIFVVEVEVLDRRKLQRALNITSSAVHPEIFFDEK